MIIFIAETDAFTTMFYAVSVQRIKSLPKKHYIMSRNSVECIKLYISVINQVLLQSQ